MWSSKNTKNCEKKSPWMLVDLGARAYCTLTNYLYGVQLISGLASKALLSYNCGTELPSSGSETNYTVYLVMMWFISSPLWSLQLHPFCFGHRKVTANTGFITLVQSERQMGPIKPTWSFKCVGFGQLTNGTTCLCVLLECGFSH